MTTHLLKQWSLPSVAMFLALCTMGCSFGLGSKASYRPRYTALPSNISVCNGMKAELRAAGSGGDYYCCRERCPKRRRGN